MAPLRPAAAPKREVDLQDALLTLADLISEPDLDVWLFGSRRFKAGSTRSDIDLLVKASKPINEKAAQEIWDSEPYLDVFEVLEGGARSLFNESRLVARSRRSLVRRLRAVRLLDGGSWRTSANQYRTQTVLAERNPAATLIPLYDLEDAVPAERADILVMTALPKEHDAVARELFGQPASSPNFSGNVNDKSGSTWRVRIRLVNEMGSVPMALATADAIRRTKATHVVLVGICAGIPGRTKLLDVVIPKTVAFYEPGKVTMEKTDQAYKHLNCDEEIARRASTLFQNSHASLSVISTEQVMACGEKVIASATARKELEASLSRKLSAIDMESYGLVQAALNVHRRPTVIKAVCDLADQHKNDGAQEDAAHAAASTLGHMIRQGVFAAPK
jgi:nucleoside phosphorylase/predicted nucleotidyltransferase